MFQYQIEGAGPADGNPSYLDPFRGEFVGVLALVYIVRALLDFYGDPEETVRVKVCCDNKTFMSQAGEVVTGRGLGTYLGPEYDVRAETGDVVAELERRGVKLDFKWVKGHQDGGGQ